MLCSCEQSAMLTTGEVCCCCCSFHVTLAGLAVAANSWHGELHAEDEESIYIAFSDEFMMF